MRFGGLVLLLGFGTALVVLFAVIRNLPDPTRIADRPISESTKIYDRTGTVLLYEIHGEEKRTVIPFEAIPDAVKQATIAIEDANFYSHRGIDIRGIMRALYVDITAQGIHQGGSTITQQLVKKTLVGEDRTLIRKIREAILAILLETKAPKDEILALYLNQIPYGSNAYGIEAAAETFFGTSAKNLTLAQAATLAALPNAPSYYSPYGSHREELLARKNMVLDRMQKQGYITAEEAERAKKEELTFISPKRNILAPHFVMYVREYLHDNYDETTVENGGLKITTTLDWDIQQKAEKAIKEGGDRNEKLTGAKNASLVALDPKTGQILAMVGSRDYWNTENDGNVNVSTRPRQPGSSFKPFAYVTAFAKGYTPETVLFDVKTEFNPGCNPDFTPGPRVNEKDCYHPGNYDGTFRGPVTLRQSLQQSLNIPSVKTLYLAGIEDTIRTAESLGISTLKDRSRFGLSLVLGGGEVKLLELVNAYGAFAQEGTFNPRTAILKIEDPRGKVLEEFKQNPIAALDPEAARTLNSVMTDNEARIPIFARESSLYFPDRMVAAKTGTTQENRDAWTVGYTPSLAAGVWVGNNDNTPMKQNTAGVMAAAPIWKKFMLEALGTSTPETFTPPSGNTASKPILRGLWQGGSIIRIDTASGKAATDLTPKEFIKEIAIGEPHTILHWVDKSDPNGPSPTNPASDPQYSNWETAERQWLQQHGYTYSTYSPAPGYDDIHTEANRPVIQLVNDVKSFPKTQKEIIFRIISTFPLQEVNARFDASAFPLTKKSVSEFIFFFPEEIEAGLHTISVSALDIYGNRRTYEREISVIDAPSS